MKPVDELYVTNRMDWREWLRKGHETEKEVWLIYYRNIPVSLASPMEIQ